MLIATPEDLFLDSQSVLLGHTARRRIFGPDHRDDPVAAQSLEGVIHTGARGLSCVSTSPIFSVEVIADFQFFDPANLLNGQPAIAHQFLFAARDYRPEAVAVFFIAPLIAFDPLAHRRMIAQVDHIELGVTDIINGNVDRTFRPVGQELDGLANGLNVMLARLLGRPEPGEEEFDEEGNPIIPGRVEFEETEEGAKPQTDPDLAALAQESEPDYYKRVFTEYVAQRKAAGSPDDVSFENFIAKLKVNEGKLKAQHQCRAVRFRVVVNDGKVTLKPVPIFA